jgi:hypothetical protein
LESLIQIVRIIVGERQGLDRLDRLTNATEWHLGMEGVIFVMVWLDFNFYLEAWL